MHPFAPSDAILQIADCLLTRLGLTLWADRPSGQYSGGNKRKLSTAISLIGNPSIIFMDVSSIQRAVHVRTTAIVLRWRSGVTNSMCAREPKCNLRNGIRDEIALHLGADNRNGCTCQALSMELHSDVDSARPKIRGDHLTFHGRMRNALQP